MTFPKYVLDKIEDWENMGNGDGYEVWLKPGWCYQGEPLHAVYGNNRKEIMEEMRQVEPCTCERCATNSL